MKRGVWLPVLLLASCGLAQAQWQIENSGTTADLRGIDNVGGGVAWASGTKGTVLRTEDGGYLWQNCAVPPGAGQLDFRGIQAFDANTAIVMSSGKGDLSRLYKTIDGCQTWRLVFTNPDKDGFWDAIVADNSGAGALVIGDPVDEHFALFASSNSGLLNWHEFRHSDRTPDAEIPPPHSKSEALFAASNSILKGDPYNGLEFVTGGAGGAYLYAESWHSWPADIYTAKFVSKRIPVAEGKSAGVFSFTESPGCDPNKRGACALVFVGGDFQKPSETAGTAAYAVLSAPGEVPGRIVAAQTPPNGFRSAVAYDAASKTWITVGPNGTDISTDDGRNWRAVHPDAALHETPDADRNWNALSLPYVVGPHGRIGKLGPHALEPSKNRK